MATIIVGHINPDLDCCVSMLLLANAIRTVYRYNGEIVYEFVPEGQTYRNIKVDPQREYEDYKGHRVYHVDGGMSIFDNHRQDLASPSSCIMIAKYFKVAEVLPEWNDIIELATREDQALCQREERDMASIILGWTRDEDMDDLDVLEGAKLMLRGLLKNAEIRIRVNKEADVKDVKDFSSFSDDGKTITLRRVRRGFGKIGVAIVNESQEVGAAQGRLGNDCVVRVVCTRDTGFIRIITQRENPIDLQETRVIQGIRAMEAGRRGLKGITKEDLACSGLMHGTGWFALKQDGNCKIVSLLLGSDKSGLSKDMQTMLKLEDILWMIEMRLASRL